MKNLESLKHYYVDRAETVRSFFLPSPLLSKFWRGLNFYRGIINLEAHMNEEMLYQAELERLGEIMESEVACYIQDYVEYL